MVRHQPLPHAFQATRGRCKARHFASGWYAPRVACAFFSRSICSPYSHALSQLASNGNRRADSQPPHRRCSAHGRLRQNYSRSCDGCFVCSRSFCLLACWPYVAWQLEWQGVGLRIRRMEILGRTPCRKNHRGAMARSRSGHRPHPRHLHDHGHCGHHDGYCRGLRPHLARRIEHSCSRCQPHTYVCGMWKTHC